MTKQTKLLNTIRWISAIAIVAIVFQGLFFTNSIIQGFIYNPILLLGLMTVYGYADFKLDSISEPVNIHRLPAPHSKISNSLQSNNSQHKAA